MGKIIERCAGIDIGKRFLLCCVLKGAAHEDPRGQTFRFDVTVPALIRLRELAYCRERHARGDGEHRIVLDSCFQYPGRSFCSGAGES